MGEREYVFLKRSRHFQSRISSQSTPGINECGRGSGMTLVELLVVIALIAIVAAFSIPNLQGWNCNREVRNDVDQLNGFLRTLRVQAMSFNRSMQAESEMASDPAQVHPNYGAQTKGRQNCESGTWTHMPIDDNPGDEALLYQFDLVLERANFADTAGFKVCFHADGTASAQTISVKTTCAGKINHYKTQIFGATGFLETTRFNTRTSQWDEL